MGWEERAEHEKITMAIWNIESGILNLQFSVFNFNQIHYGSLPVWQPVWDMPVSFFCWLILGFSQMVYVSDILVHVSDIEVTSNATYLFAGIRTYWGEEDSPSTAPLRRQGCSRQN
jgi:hypothetical protein